MSSKLLSNNQNLAESTETQATQTCSVDIQYPVMKLLETAGVSNDRENGLLPRKRRKPTIWLCHVEIEGPI